jgi:hypothetical protein
MTDPRQPDPDPLSVPEDPYPEPRSGALIVWAAGAMVVAAVLIVVLMSGWRP